MSLDGRDSGSRSSTLAQQTAEMKAFEEKVSAQLQEAKAKIDEIETQVKGKLAQAEIDAIKFFKTTIQEIDKKRQHLRASSESRAAQLKADIEADVAKLKTSLEQFSTKAKSQGASMK